jgi:hypothetical protein
MYIDGHKCDYVVEYRNGFVKQWKEYEKQMVTYNNNSNESPMPAGFDVPQLGQFRLILITHDESTFYAHDRQRIFWSHLADPNAPKHKREGPSLMTSDMLTSEWGRLMDGDEWVCFINIFSHN